MSSGRIRRTELRLKLSDIQLNLDRLTCEVNGTKFHLETTRSVANSTGDTWLVVDNPPLVNGENHVLVLLEGTHSPAGWHRSGPGIGPNWPSVEQCELVVICSSI